MARYSWNWKEGRRTKEEEPKPYKPKKGKTEEDKVKPAQTTGEKLQTCQEGKTYYGKDGKATFKCINGIMVPQKTITAKSSK